jgi:hypothetical protein
MNIINAHGLRAPSHALPYDASVVLARYAAKCRRRLGMPAIADKIVTATTPWHPDILAAQAAGARMAGVDAQGRQPSGCRALTHEELRDAWPWAEHSRPGKLTEADLDRAIAAKKYSRMPLPELLLHMGAMTHDTPPTLWQRVRRAWADLLGR